MVTGAGPAAAGVVFAPRWATSRVSVPFTMVTGHPEVRKIAAKNILGFIGANAALAAFLKLSGVADVSFDRKSSDFGKIRIGNTRFDAWSGFQQWAVMTFRVADALAKGDLKQARAVAVRFGEGKLAPFPGLINDITKGRTYLGDEIATDPNGIAKQAWDRFAPMIAQDVVDVVREDGAWLAGVALPAGVLGIGVQSYGGDLPKVRQVMVDQAKWYTQDGKPITQWNQLNQGQKHDLRQGLSQMKELEEKRRQEWANRDDWSKQRYALEQKEKTDWEELAAAFLMGKIRPQDYLDQATRFKTLRSARFEWGEAVEGEPDYKLLPEDQAMQAYKDILNNPIKVNAVPDWEATQKKTEDYLRQLDPKIQDYIEKHKNDWIDNLPPLTAQVERERKNAVELLKDYWDIEDRLVLTLPEKGQPIWKRYREIQDTTEGKKMRLDFWGIRQFESQLRSAREAYRRQHPDADTALRRWGYLEEKAPAVPMGFRAK